MATELHSRRGRRDARLSARGAHGSDLALGLTGAALAASASIFAIVEFVANDGVPKVNGGAYLSLFAKPSTSVASLDARQSQSGSRAGAMNARTPADGRSVDYSSTATIRRSRSEAGERVDGGGAAPAVDEATAGAGAHEIAIEIGGALPRGGVIRSIERRNGRWLAIVDPGDQSSR